MPVKQERPGPGSVVAWNDRGVLQSCDETRDCPRWFRDARTAYLHVQRADSKCRPVEGGVTANQVDAYNMFELESFDGDEQPG